MLRKWTLIFIGLAFVIGSLASLPVAVGAQEKHLDVPFVPTKYPVVDEMLRITKVTKNDIVYDLGCGDGRIVVTAALKYGAHGVGIDIDPERIQESKENAAKNKVTNLVQFREGDLFQADIHDATVLTMYLLTSVNLKLRPKLLRELRPGTRLVSHNFGMDEWKPDESSEVMVDDISHDVYLWIIPANISGTWKWTMGSPPGSYEMQVNQLFQVVSGTVTLSGKSVPLKDISLRGADVKFVLEIPYGGATVPVHFAGTSLGNTISGSAKSLDQGKPFTWDWKASRNPATMKSIDGTAER
jgi:SAM-dependent methyltransferase